MNLNKIIGYVLLSIGLLLISFITFQSYQIFTGNATAPYIFKIQTDKSTDSTSYSGVIDLQKQIEKQVSESVRDQILAILPSENISKMLNLMSWFLFALIVIISGTHISSIGIKMIKQNGI